MARFLRPACVMALWISTFSLQCYSAEVIFLSAPKGSDVDRSYVEIAARFYGLAMLPIAPTGDDDPALAISLARPGVLALIIAADALSRISPSTVTRAIEARPEGVVPVLILGVNADTNADLV